MKNRAFRAYQKIKTLKPARSLFDLSHEVMMTCEMFKLYPVCLMEMSPGDTFHIANQSVTRLQPLNAPMLSPISMSTHYFFVPYRILDEDFVEFITGGIDGENGGTDREDEPPETAPVLPRWIPTKKGIGSLWDYCGFPVNVDPKGAYPLDYVRRAYNMIWNEFYRDENNQDPVDLDNEDILFRCWSKDYFTSALLNQQRGVSPAMPVVGTAPIQTSSSSVALSTFTMFSGNGNIQLIQEFDGKVSKDNFIFDNVISIVVDGVNSTATLRNFQANYSSPADKTQVIANYYYTDSGNASSVSGNVTVNTSSVDFSSSGAGFDVKDLRQAFQIQKWLELANRGGVRYTEFLRSFFGVSPRDDRLQRPEYIGGSKSPIVISEVLQTSSTDNQPTPQGQMAGHGIGAARTYVGSYSAQEYGILVGLVSYTTPPLYTQGINRQWLRRTKYDFLFPQFTHLSEQAIEGAEVYATDDATENRKVWGYNEVYDELRSMASRVVGKMRSVFNYWHLARFFNSKPALNEDFVSGKDVSKRIFAVQNEEGIILDYANIIRAVRPIPKYGTPGGV